MINPLSGISFPPASAKPSGRAPAFSGGKNRCITGDSFVRFAGTFPIIRTVDDYCTLTGEECKSLSNAPVRGESYSLPHSALLEDLTKLAEKFNKEYPASQYHMAAFGRSALLFLEILQAMDGGHENYTRLAGSNFRYVSLPDRRILSASEQDFQKWLRENPVDSICIKDYTKQRQNYLSYLQYMQDKGMDVESIIKRAQAGQKTVILDGFSSGQTIINFAKFLLADAENKGLEKEIKNSVVFHLFSPWHNSESVRRSLNPLKQMGFTVNVTGTDQEPTVKAIETPMNNDSYGIGTSYSIRTAAQDYSGILVAEENVRSSKISSLVLFDVMSHLNSRHLLRQPAVTAPDTSLPESIVMPEATPEPVPALMPELIPEGAQPVHAGWDKLFPLFNKFQSTLTA